MPSGNGCSSDSRKHQVLRRDHDPGRADLAVAAGRGRRAPPAVRPVSVLIATAARKLSCVAVDVGSGSKPLLRSAATLGASGRRSSGSKRSPMSTSGSTSSYGPRRPLRKGRARARSAARPPVTSPDGGPKFELEGQRRQVRCRAARRRARRRRRAAGRAPARPTARACRPSSARPSYSRSSNSVTPDVLAQPAEDADVARRHQVVRPVRAADRRPGRSRVRPRP